MVKIKFIIDTKLIRKPLIKPVIKMIAEHIKLLCGCVYIEAPKGYLKKKDLK